MAVKRAAAHCNTHSVSDTRAVDNTHPVVARHHVHLPMAAGGDSMVVTSSGLKQLTSWDDHPDKHHQPEHKAAAGVADNSSQVVEHYRPVAVEEQPQHAIHCQTERFQWLL